MTFVKIQNGIHAEPITPYEQVSVLMESGFMHGRHKKPFVQIVKHFVAMIKALLITLLGKEDKLP